MNDLSSIVKGVPRPDRSRAALIDTAATLFRRQGYAATGLNQILDDAGVKAGSLYHHFPGGKQELAAAVVESAGAQIERVLRAALADDAPVASVVDRWLDMLAGRAGRGLPRRLPGGADRHRIRACERPRAAGRGTRVRQLVCGHRGAASQGWLG